MKNLSIKIFLIFVILIQSQYVIASGSLVIGDLTEALKRNDIDKVLSLVNDAKELAYQGEAIKFMYSLWTEKKLPVGVSSSLIRKDIVRINVADYLVQAHNNGLFEVDKKEFQVFARKILSGDDVEAASAALFVLAHINDSKDVKLIEQHVLSKSKYLFRSATLALAMMCDESSDKSLLALEKKVSAARREFLVSTREKFLSMKKKGFYCNN